MMAVAGLAVDWERRTPKCTCSSVEPECANKKRRDTVPRRHTSRRAHSWLPADVQHRQAAQLPKPHTHTPHSTHTRAALCP